MTSRAVGLALLVSGLSAALGAPTGLASAALPNRLVIDLTLVSSGDAALDRALNQWSNLLRLRLPNILQDPSLKLDRADRVQIRSNPVTAAPTPAAMANRWQQTQAIQVIAAVSARTGNAIVIDGSIYFGSLKGALPAPRLPIRQVVRVDRYREAADVVSLATLYALAMDAGPTNRAAACELLQRARTIARGMHGSSGGVELGRAVVSSLSENRCGG